MISIDYTLIIVILNFILLLVLLNKILYQPLKKFLAERQTAIASDVEKAEQDKQKAIEMVKNQEEEYKQFSLEIRKLKEQTKRDAEKQGDEIISSARDRERDILIDAEKQLAQEKIRVINEIESELGSVITALTSKIIGKEISEEIDANIIKKLLSEQD